MRTNKKIENEIGRIEHGDSVLVVRCGDHDGESRVDIRWHWRDKGGELRGSGRGVNFPRELAPEMVGLMLKSIVKQDKNENGN